MSESLASKDMFDNFQSKIHDLLEIKEVIGIDDIMELSDDFSKIFKLFRGSYNLISQKKFEIFLKNIGSNEEPTEEQINKLMNYVDNKEKAEFISNIFSKILLSKSTKSCAIMGYIMNDILKNNENPKHEFLILIEALTNFFDFDINNFKIINKYLNTYGIKYVSNDGRFIQFIQNNRVDKDSMTLSLEKTVVHQLVCKEIDIDADVQNEDYDFNSVDSSEVYRLTVVGKLLNEYILKLNL